MTVINIKRFEQLAKDQPGDDIKSVNLWICGGSSPVVMTASLWRRLNKETVHKVMNSIECTDQDAFYAIVLSNCSWIEHVHEDGKITIPEWEK